MGTIQIIASPRTSSRYMMTDRITVRHALIATSKLSSAPSSADATNTMESALVLLALAATTAPNLCAGPLLREGTDLCEKAMTATAKRAGAA